MLRTLIIILFCLSSFICEPVNNSISSSDSIPRLHQAIIDDQSNVVDSLLKIGDSAMAKDSLDETPLMYACRKKEVNYGILQLLLREKVEILYESDSTFNSALYYAIDNANSELVSFLVLNFSKEDRLRFQNDPSYVSYAIVSNQPRIFDLLLSFQQSLGFFKMVNQSYFEIAIENLVHCDDLLSTKMEWEGKEKISRDSAIQVLNILFKKGYNINEDKFFERIFNIASRSTVAMRLLVENDLDLNREIISHTESYSLASSFIRSIVKNSDNTFNILGEDVNLFNSEKFELYLTVLDSMKEKGALLSNGYNDLYDYLILECVLQNKISLLKVLDVKGKLKNIHDLNGKSIMIIASENGYDEIVNFLVKKGF